MRQLAAGVALLVSVAACASVAESSAMSSLVDPGTASPSSSPSPTLTPTPTPVPRFVPGSPFEPVPTPDSTAPPSIPDDLPIQARREENGVLVTIRLEQNPMPAGEPIWLYASVENTGIDPVVWFHDGCATLVRAGGLLDARWREGMPMSGDPGLFKRYALGLGLDGSGPVPLHIRFTPEDQIGRGRVGCADIGIADEIPPGGIVQSRLQWNGLVAGELGLPPRGLMSLLGSFEFFWRASEGEPDNIIDRRIEIPLDVWIDPGKPAKLLDPPEIIDTALADAEFAGWFATKDFANGVEDYVRYRLDIGRWEIGVVEWNTPQGARLTYLVIDPITGAVLDRIARPFDIEVDTKP